jgi:surface protein
VLYFNNMFKSATGLTSLDVTNFNTSNALEMKSMFERCYALSSVDVTNFDTSNVTSMYFMFYYLGHNTSSITDVPGVENFNIEALNVSNALEHFLSGTSIPTARYDALLINWDAQDPLDNMNPVRFGSSTYTAGGTAAAARANLISTDGWTITDGGTA